MTTKVCRDLHGSWKAETYINLEPGAGIRLITRKVVSGVLVTTATRVTTNDGVISYAMFRDYHEIIKAERVRVTSNAVKAQHDAALAQMDDIKSKCAAFYANKEKAA